MDRKLWLEERQKSLGGSEAAAVCGLSPWRTPYQVWEDKLNLSEPQEPTEAMEWGSLLEPLIRQRYSDVTGRAVRLPSGILHHPTVDFMSGSIDGFTEDERLIEIKTSRFGEGWGEEGSDEIPVPYILQVQHYLAVTGLKVADVPVLIGGQDFRIYEVKADLEFQEKLIEKETAFWELVKTGTPPEPINTQDAIKRYAKSQGKSLVATENIVLALKALSACKKEIESYEAELEIAKLKVMSYMGEADTLANVDGEILCTWKSDRSGKPIQIVKEAMKALKKEYPDIYSKYWEEGKPSRRFLIKESK